MLDMPANTVETCLTWSPMGQKNLAVLTGDRMYQEGFFLHENVWAFLTGGHKVGF